MSAFALNGNGYSVLEYRDLPPRAYRAARDTLVRLGFPEEGIVREWDFSYQDDQRVKTNAMVFADPVQRTPGEYASISLYNKPAHADSERAVEVLAHSMAPFHLIHHADSFQLWGSSTTARSGGDVRSIPVETDIAYDQLTSVLHRYSSDLKPERIIDVKQGRDRFSHPAFSDIQPFQLTLWALDITSKLLVRYFRQAVHQLRQPQTLSSMNVPDDLVPDIAVQLLGAVVLADTGVLGNSLRSANVPLDKLIQVASKEFDRYFITEYFERYALVIEDAYRQMRNISYAGFVPDMLSKLYVEAFGEEKRKDMGRYDTPYYLTRRIWDNIPVEFLAPEQRIVADMSCGWGSFLTAAYQRLSRLTDMGEKPMREYLHGNDIDRFTARLAGLGLLISTSSDNWHIDFEGVSEWRWLEQHRPNIIVGNPPFAGNRRAKYEDQEGSSEDSPKRYQKADLFLSRAVEHLAPGGYLAMIMPQSFVVAEASPGLRKQLLASCDVLELWELPMDVFGEVRANTTVLFAQKKADPQQSSTMPVRVRSVQRSTLDAFKQYPIFTASSIVADQSVWAGTRAAGTSRKASKHPYIMDFHLALPEADWATVRAHCVPLQERALVFLGAAVGSNKLWADYKFPKIVNWLSNAKRTIPEPFYIDYSNKSSIIYPNDLERPRKNTLHPERDREAQLAGPKVLLTASHNPSWGARVKVAIERLGYYVSDSFWVITELPMPTEGTEHITLEVLAAVVSWKVSNAWVLDHLKYPKLPSRAVEHIPFPRHLSQADSAALTEAVRALEKEVARGVTLSQAQASLVIDGILRRAYQLDDATYERLSILADWDQNPLLTLDEDTAPSELGIETIGGHSTAGQPSGGAHNDVSGYGGREGNSEKVEIGQSRRRRANWQTNGFVKGVDAAEGTITLWLEGFDEVQTVPIHPAMPGWLLRPDVEFKVRIPSECRRARALTDVTWGHFEPQGFTYLEEEELLQKLSSFVYAEGQG